MVGIWKWSNVDSSYGVWSKVEGKRSHLKKWQLSLLLENWDCSRNSNDIMKIMISIIPEFSQIK